MTQTLKIIKRTFQILLIIFILWVVGLFAQLPLIPLIETDYVLSGTNQTLGKGIDVLQTNTLNIKIEIPNYFPENDQCLDTWFYAPNGQHILTVSNYSISVFRSDGSEIKKQNSYLFWDKGSKDEAFKIENYPIAKSDTAGNNKYVFFRSVYDVDNEKEFLVHIKANFSLDSAISSLEKKLSIIKRHRLTWNKFRAH